MIPDMLRPFFFTSEDTTPPKEKTKIRPQSSGTRTLVAVADRLCFTKTWTENVSDVLIPEDVKGILGAGDTRRGFGNRSVDTGPDEVGSLVVVHYE